MTRIESNRIDDNHDNRVGDVALLAAHGVSVDAIQQTLLDAPPLKGARIRVLCDAHSVPELDPRAIVVAVFSTRLGESFEDLIGLRFAGVSWVAVVPTSHALILPDLCRDAGAIAVITEGSAEATLPAAILRAFEGPSHNDAGTSAAFVAMLTHVLGQSIRMEIKGPAGESVDLDVQRGMPWSCCRTDGPCGTVAALEALSWRSTEIRIGPSPDDAARNIFVTWPDLFRTATGTRFGQPDDRSEIHSPGAEAWEAIHHLGLGGVVRTAPSTGGVLAPLTALEGFLGACIVEVESGKTLEQEKGPTDIDLQSTAAVNAELIRGSRGVLRSLRLSDVEEMLITLEGEYHLIRPLRTGADAFYCVVLDRAAGSPPVAQLRLRELENGTLVSVSH